MLQAGVQWTRRQVCFLSVRQEKRGPCFLQPHLPDHSITQSCIGIKKQSLIVDLGKGSLIKGGAVKANVITSLLCNLGQIS